MRLPNRLLFCRIQSLFAKLKQVQPNVGVRSQAWDEPSQR
jgi:hypothetical protein